MLKVTYKQLTAFPFQMVMQKLQQAPTDGKTAYRIMLMAAAIKEVRDKISAEYKKDLLGVYAVRDDKGAIVGGEEGWSPAEDKKDEFLKAQEAFSERVAELDRPKFTFQDIKDIRPTADELDALEPIFDPAGLDAPDEPAQLVGGPRIAGGRRMR